MGARSGSTDLAAHYAELLKEQERSGLSVSEFAEEAEVSAATLYAWRRRLREPDAQARLLEVSLVGDEAASSVALTLHVDDRFMVELPADFDADTLERLLAALDRC